MNGSGLDDRPLEGTSHRRKLLVVGRYLSNQSSHHFNELLAYRTAAETLGLESHFVVSQNADPRLAAAFSADLALDPLPSLARFDPATISNQLVAFADASAELSSLWNALDAESLSDIDMILFTPADPILISAAGAWLAQRPAIQRPGIFFRITGHEAIDLAADRYNHTAIFFRIACSDLRTRLGQERVFLLAENPAVARKMARACARRTFEMPLPKKLDLAGHTDPPEPARPTVYVHVNSRSAALLGMLAAIFHRVSASHPAVKFIVKASGLSDEQYAKLRREVASQAKFLPPEQGIAEYLANFSRCSVVLLAYEPLAYRNITSGVFVEAASFGKPVIVPSGTWMADQIAAGHGSGTTFDTPDADSICTALYAVLADIEGFGASARSVSTEMHSSNSGERYIERMMVLLEQRPDMHPRYQIGDEIDFSDPLDSRCFIREGWGETEAWGVWTVGRSAKLFLRFSSNPGQKLTLKALVRPFLTPGHRDLCVSILAGDQNRTHWTFSFNPSTDGRFSWREASVAIDDNNAGERALEISFAIDSPISPLAAGASTDSRPLGLGLQKLVLCPDV